jgi:hypothetical protein
MIKNLIEYEKKEKIIESLGDDLVNTKEQEYYDQIDQIQI